MSIPLDRLVRLCPPMHRDSLALLSAGQIRRLKRQIRLAITYAKSKASVPMTVGRPRTSTHPRAEYWRKHAHKKYRAAKRKQALLVDKSG